MALNAGNFKNLFKSTTKDAFWRGHACVKYVDEDHCGEDPKNNFVNLFSNMFDTLERTPTFGVNQKA
jgi:hypothetical protein